MLAGKFDCSCPCRSREKHVTQKEQRHFFSTLLLHNQPFHFPPNTLASSRCFSPVPKICSFVLAVCDPNCLKCSVPGKCLSTQCKPGYRYRSTDQTCERTFSQVFSALGDAGFPAFFFFFFFLRGSSICSSDQRIAKSVSCFRAVHTCAFQPFPAETGIILMHRLTFATGLNWQFAD